MESSGISRWAGRNSAKDAVRGDIWRKLVESGVNVGPSFDRIPNFVGADMAAKRLSELDEWKRARMSSNAIPIRRRSRCGCARSMTASCCSRRCPI